MLSLYTVLLTVHILAVIAWLGSGVFAFLISTKLEDPKFAAAVSSVAAIFPVAGMIAALAGIGMWIDGPWDFGEVWILIAVAGWIASSAIGGAKISKAVEAWAQGDAAARLEYQRFARIDMAILTLVVIDMVMKPGL